MKDISLHILDIVQNSVVAQATNIEIKSIIQKLNSGDSPKNLLPFNSSDYFLEFHILYLVD